MNVNQYNNAEASATQSWRCIYALVSLAVSLIKNIKSTVLLNLGNMVCFFNHYYLFSMDNKYSQSFKNNIICFVCMLFPRNYFDNMNILNKPDLGFSQQSKEYWGFWGGSHGFPGQRIQIYEALFMLLLWLNFLKKD